MDMRGYREVTRPKSYDNTTFWDHLLVAHTWALAFMLLDLSRNPVSPIFLESESDNLGLFFTETTGYTMEFLSAPKLLLEW